jgi:exopolysaccharide biosynthesis WecB/TagA/CpsF family protein
LPIFLFGTTPSGRAFGVEVRWRRQAADDVEFGARVLRKLLPRDGEDADAALARIAQSGTRICYVALGAPKQELFATRAITKGINVGFICIGASLDFLAGEQVRAPPTFPKAGLEWLWRLGTNPCRLATRCTQCAVLLAGHTLFQPLYAPSSGRDTPSSPNAPQSQRSPAPTQFSATRHTRRTRHSPPAGHGPKPMKPPRILFHGLVDGGGERLWACLATSFDARGYDVLFAQDFYTDDNRTNLVPDIALHRLGRTPPRRHAQLGPPAGQGPARRGHGGARRIEN